MTCEHVKELLSAYLDNMLVTATHSAVARHLHTCTGCNALLEDYRRFDSLLAQLPRIHPTYTLHYKIFSCPEYLQLTKMLKALQQSESS